MSAVLQTDHATPPPGKEAEKSFSFAEAKESFMEARELQQALVTQAGEVIAQAASAILEKQASLLRWETEQALKGLGSLGRAPTEETSVSSYVDDFHDGLEQAVADIRAINDLVRDCSWRLFGLYAEGWRQVAQTTRH